MVSMRPVDHVACKRVCKCLCRSSKRVDIQTLEPMKLVRRLHDEKLTLEVSTHLFKHDRRDVWTGRHILSLALKKTTRGNKK